MRAMRRRAIWMHVVAPVLIGAGIYVSWRSPSLLFFRWFELAGLWPVAEDIRSVLAGIRELLPKIVLFSAPDALWVYALTSVMLIIWHDRTNVRRAWWWVSAALVLTVLTEVGQMMGWVPGTFDVADLLLSIAAAVLAVVNIRRINMEEMHAA